MIGDKISGYTVTESVSLGNAKFVLGENPNNPIVPFATWQANIKNGEHDYFWGHYTDTRENALKDFGERISREAEYQQSFKEKNKAEIEQER